MLPTRASCLSLLIVLTGCADTSPAPLGEKIAPLTQSVTFRRGTHAVADTFISERAQRVNFGDKKVLRVTHKKEALLRFDLSSIPAEAVIQSARLTLFVNGEDEDDDDCEDRRHLPVTVHRVKRAWNENTVTYKSFDQRFDADIEGLLHVTSQSAYKTVDIKDLVRDWVSGQKPNHGLLLKTWGRTRAVFVSSEHNQAQQRPSLEIVYTTPDDHCDPNPCDNGGVCTNGLDGFTCECAPGFIGETCSDPVDRCQPNPCANAGVCSQDGEAFVCACAPGFGGLTCETNLDECSPNPCENGGTCTDGVAEFTCACPPGYTGELCETNIDECAGDPCQNDALCVDLIAGYECLCGPGFTGPHCEIDIDDCASNACQNGATCIDGVNGYTCSCAPGFTGPLCEVNPDDCESAPCLNDGTCIDGLASYTCACASGYGGELCEVDLDDCASNPCVNGQCVDLVAGFLCVCNNGWVGATCDVCPTGYAGPECVALDCQPGQEIVGDRCEPCPSGRFGTGGQADCELCPAGTFSFSTDLDVGPTECTPCPAGTFTGPGSAFCEPCLDGQSSPGGSAGCAPCAPGSYSNADTTHLCEPCEADTIAPDAGSAECLACGPNEVSNPDATACEQVVCQPGRQPVNGTCELCPAGTSSDGTACVPCAPGSVAQAGSATCTACGSCATAQTSTQTCVANPPTVTTVMNLEGDVTCTSYNNLPGLRISTIPQDSYSTGSQCYTTAPLSHYVAILGFTTIPGFDAVRWKVPPQPALEGRTVERVLVTVGLFSSGFPTLTFRLDGARNSWTGLTQLATASVAVSNSQVRNFVANTAPLSGFLPGQDWLHLRLTTTTQSAFLLVVSSIKVEYVLACTP